MSAKIQVNIRLTPEEHARLLKWADEAGLQPGVLARDIVVEGLDAKAEDRPMFSREVFGPGDAIALLAKFDKAVMEVERFANTWATHQSDLFSREQEDQRAVHSARAEFLAGFPERISGSLNPIRAEMASMQAAMTAAIAEQPRLDAIDKKQEELGEAVQKNTEAIEELRKDPRKAFGLILGDGRIWSTVFVCQWSLLMAVIGAAFIPGVGIASPSVGIPLANKMVAGDAEFCRLIRYRFETDSCQVPAAHRIDPAGKPAKAPNKSSRTKKGAALAMASRS